jgi:hypothetical protein
MALALALLLLAAIFLRALAITFPEPAGPTDRAEQCQEDDPCWNCETMGNLLCGLPVLP